MIKHIEIKTYEYNNIKVMVKIDYDKKEISLVDDVYGEVHDHHAFLTPKHYVFTNRTIEYMQGWLKILDGIKYAISEAEKELREYFVLKQKEKECEVTEILTKASELVKQKSLKSKKK